MNWEPVIGLEVHAQLRTKSKIFCGCSTAVAEEPNSHVCPICLGMPGTLPVFNQEVARFAIRTGLALGCDIQTDNVFARKNYFYPDLPKGYQISQFDKPICLGGEVRVPHKDGSENIVRIHRIHMEEDAGKTIHGEGGDNHSYVDYNRTGIPLMEIVSEADMRSPAEAGGYLRALHQTIRYIEVCDGNMELGQFRCDANISIRPAGQEKFGIRAEMKNMNSFRNVEKALEYEINRQIAVLSQGGTVVQESRLWDAAAGKSRPMRGKEEAHDYRYFPEPDLLPIAIPEGWIGEIRETLPELPADRRARYREQFGLSPYDAQVLTTDKEVANYYEATVAHTGEPKKTANFIMAEVLREIKTEDSIENFPITPERLAGLLTRVEDGTISGKIAKEVLPMMIADHRDADVIIDEKGLRQVTDSDALEETIRKVLAGHPDEVARFRAGEKKLTGFFVGQIMKATRGKANPQLANQLLASLLAAS